MALIADRKNLLRQIPKQKLASKQSNVSRLFKNTEMVIMEYLEDLSKFNGNAEDSPEKILKEFRQMFLMGIVVAVFMFAMLEVNQYLCIGIGIVFPFIPIIIRYLDKQQFKKDYVESFYNVINYVILYTSSGVMIFNVFELIERIIQPEDVIKPSLQNIIKARKIGGLSSGSFSQSIRILNEGLELPEIQSFIRTIDLQQQRGTPLEAALRMQLDGIKQRKKLDIAGKIASVESKVTLLKTTLCAMPILAIMIVPPVMDALEVFKTAGI